MKCLNPTTIRVKRKPETLANLITNGINPSDLPEYMEVPCGKCLHCLKRKAREWRVRLSHEQLFSNRAYFCTLTINPETLSDLEEGILSSKDLIRRFTELYRKRYKKPALRHWFIEELGERSGRFHYHGFIFEPLCDDDILAELWSKFGFSSFSKITAKRINYALGYLTDPATMANNFSPQIFASKGIGRDYLNSRKSKTYDPKTLPSSMHFNGMAHPLPRYYYTKLYTDVDRVTHAKIHQQNNYETILKNVKYTSTSTNQYEKPFIANTTLARQNYLKKRHEYFIDSVRRGTSKTPRHRQRSTPQMAPNLAFLDTTDNPICGSSDQEVSYFSSTCFPFSEAWGQGLEEAP